MTSPVDRLKELLFDAEAQRLVEVQRRIDALSDAERQRHDDWAKRQGLLQDRVDQVFERAGTVERLQKSVAEVIDGALRDAEVTKHEPLSRAVAPLVIKTIKTELKNSQAELVEAVYPMTGMIVKQYVQAAMADLTADINRRLGGKLPSELEARAKSLGVSVGELALVETEELKVDELFLVKRGSGDLVAHWERMVEGGVASSGTGSNRDILIAGYLTGITAFSEEAFDETKGSLRALDMDGQRIFVRASPAYLLAARCSGRAPQSVERIIDDEFMRVLSAYQDGMTAAATTDNILPSVARSLGERFDTERQRIERDADAASKPAGFGRLYALLAVILLPLIAWFSWQTWRHWQVQRVLSEARGVLSADATLRGYPITLQAADGGRRLVVAGLTPSTAARGRFVEALRRALPDTGIEDASSVLAQPTDDRTSRDRLDAFARDRAVFFAEGLEFADGRSANEAVERLAGLMRDNDAVMRVIGYTDDRGDPVANQQLAQTRAERIAVLLVAQGIARARLAVVGRTGGLDLSRTSGPGSANRRVSFELGYVGEPTP